MPALKRREERRGQRVHALRAVELERGNVGGRVEVEGEEVVHRSGACCDAPSVPAPRGCVDWRAMDTLVAADGTRLVPHDWPMAGPAHGTVLVVHGLGEHAGRYGALATQLNAAGWHVVGYDQRGHGRSGGPRGGLARDDSLLTDLAQVVDHVRAQWPGRLVMLGHSMGGLVAARFVAESVADAPAGWSRVLDALVLSSPALDPGMGWFDKLLLAAGSLMPDHAVGNGLKPDWVSRDPAVVTAYVADPLNHDRITPRLARFIVDGGARVRELAPRWATPTLLQWAGADRCVAPAGSAGFAAAAPTELLQARCFDGLFHEIFNEPEKREVVAELLRWLAAPTLAQGDHA
jgi:alpha-beta hydrolase superfamily lysophospholipase